MNIMLKEVCNLNTIFKNYMLKQLNNSDFSDNSILSEITDNKCAKKIIEKHMRYTKSLEIPSIYKQVLTDFTQRYDSLLKKYKYDKLSKNPSAIFGSVNNYDETLAMYIYFDLDQCKQYLKMKPIYTFNEITNDSIFASQRPNESLRPVDWDNPITLVQTIGDYEYLVIDGNHRYKNAIRQHSNIPMKCIFYENIEPKFFLNDFNYILFMFKNEYFRILSLCFGCYPIDIIKKQINDSISKTLYLLEEK